MFGDEVGVIFNFLRIDGLQPLRKKSFKVHWKGAIARTCKFLTWSDSLMASLVSQALNREWRCSL